LAAKFSLEDKVVAKKEEQQREPKDLRYRRQYFADGEKLVFHTAYKGFVPLPIIFRKLFRHLSAAGFRVLAYLHLRASRYGICYPTLEEIAHELGLSGRKNLTPHLKSLEEKRFISTHTAGGKKFYLIHDPRVAIEHLGTQGKLTDADFYEINDLYEDLRQSPVALPKKATKGD
jgi:hypothetical protein